MKELFYKDILGSNPKKREISIEEVNSRVMSTISKKWISKYFIKDKFTSEDHEILRKWIFMKKGVECRKDCHILRHYDSRTGENKIVCKVLGDLYLICGNTAYKLVYINELRIQIEDRKEREGVYDERHDQ